MTKNPARFWPRQTTLNPSPIKTRTTTVENNLLNFLLLLWILLQSKQGLRLWEIWEMLRVFAQPLNPSPIKTRTTTFKLATGVRYHFPLNPSPIKTRTTTMHARSVDQEVQELWILLQSATSVPYRSASVGRDKTRTTTFQVFFLRLTCLSFESFSNQNKDYDKNSNFRSSFCNCSLNPSPLGYVRPVPERMRRSG